jgi:hypothetical protein
MSQARFSHLEIGTEFSYQNASYRKSTPLLAVSSDNHQRMIPRSAMVTINEKTASPIKVRMTENSIAINPQDVVEAINQHSLQCQSLLQSLATPLNLSQIDQGKFKLEAMKDELISRLGIGIINMD